MTNALAYTDKLPRRTAQVQVPARRPGITTTGFRIMYRVVGFL